MTERVHPLQEIGGVFVIEGARYTSPNGEECVVNSADIDEVTVSMGGRNGPKEDIPKTEFTDKYSMIGIPEDISLDQVYSSRMNTIENAIIDTWWGYDDFEEGGIEYVAFVMMEDIRDILQYDGEEDQMEEMADICINSMRWIIESGYLPSRVILDRLDNHIEKDQERIIDWYQEVYSEFQSNGYDIPIPLNEYICILGEEYESSEEGLRAIVKDVYEDNSKTKVKCVVTECSAASSLEVGEEIDVNYSAFQNWVCCSQS